MRGKGRAGIFQGFALEGQCSIMAGDVNVQCFIQLTGNWTHGDGGLGI